MNLNELKEAYAEIKTALQENTALIVKVSQESYDEYARLNAKIGDLEAKIEALDLGADGDELLAGLQEVWAGLTANNERLHALDAIVPDAIELEPVEQVQPEPADGTSENPPAG